MATTKCEQMILQQRAMNTGRWWKVYAPNPKGRPRQVNNNPGYTPCRTIAQPIYKTDAPPAPHLHYRPVAGQNDIHPPISRLPLGRLVGDNGIALTEALRAEQVSVDAMRGKIVDNALRTLVREVVVVRDSDPL
jgi:hypothetical protein